MANSKKRCRACKEYDYTEKMVLINGSYYCSINEATKHGYKNKEKGKVIIQKIQKKKDQVRKKELTSITKWRSKLQKLINQWIVHVRDKNKPCYTCGTINPSIKYDAGHRHHAGRGGADRRRFVLENIHKQCSVNCNQHGGGKPREYDIALDLEYGKGFADHLNCEANYSTLKEQFPTWHNIEAEIIRYRKLLRDNGITPNA